ncbi:MAG: heavy metal sensor histidine kinase [Steroidobacteraceae bacterium]
MFWKRAADAGVDRTRRAAMSTWLTLYYTAAATALLGAASVLFYFGLQHSLDAASWDSLEEKTGVVAELLAHRRAGPLGVPQEVIEEAQISGNFRSRFLLRVLDARRQVLTETPGMSTALPDALFPWVPLGAQEGRAEVRRHGRRYLLISEAISTVRSGGAPWRLQAALDMSPVQQLLANYLRQMLIVLGGGVLLAAVLGAWVARRGLRPIAAITEATERVGAERLHERIAAAGWPAELTVLAGAFDGMLERLQQAFERLEQFSADIAHELRTPINTLMGEAQVALAHERSAGEYVEVLQSALEEYGRLARMIDSMLFLAYADHTRRAPERTVLDALHEMQTVVEFYQPLAEESGVRLRCSGEAPLYADPQLLRRALSNLVSNALKHTRRGGSVRLEARRAPQGGCWLEVVDSGIGIAPEHLPKLTDRFYRVDASRGAREGGAGLGLAIVHSIMALHGGSLSIDSAVGLGTIVHLYFPPADPA